ncbi:hypothetical protein BGZ65_010270 [Modicella reniformis]|uniref:Uncharacterized protein n=1 Tax=Modicella reniformis TaxID=1440133 RepID=A0A9P6IML4_9FUNG|nr:hypothetical protein BGZ65_010270 [Modicella reniformis]
MGSSIGLIVFQSLQSFYLKRLGSTLTKTASSGGYSGPIGTAFSSFSGAEAAAQELSSTSTSTLESIYAFFASSARFLSPTSSSPPSSSTTTSLESSSSTLRHFGSFLLLMWLPLTVWFLSMTICTLWIKYRKIVPQTLTPRNAILLSQGIFTLFWIILGAVQEVQERLSFSYSSFSRITGLTPPSWGVEESSLVPSSSMDPMDCGRARATAAAAAQDIPLSILLGSSSAQQQQQQQQQGILTLLTPLCVAQYVAIVLLGIATGLLTTSSTILEEQMEIDYHNQQQEEQEQQQQQQDSSSENGYMLLIEPEEQEEEEEDNDDETMGPSDPLLGSSRARSGLGSGSYSEPESSTKLLRHQLTFLERLGLLLWVVILLSSQLWFFQWIVTHGSLPNLTEKGADICGSGIGNSLVSSCLTIFGLYSGTIMITLGLRL